MSGNVTGQRVLIERIDDIQRLYQTALGFEIQEVRERRVVLVHVHQHAGTAGRNGSSARGCTR